MIPLISIRASYEHICESNLFYFLYIWFRYMASRDSTFVIHMNCMSQSYNDCSWIDAYNYGFTLIHDKCLSCKIFRGCNKEANHKIRFSPWFYFVFCIFLIFQWCKIRIQEENKKNQLKKLHTQHCSHFLRHFGVAIWYGTTTRGSKIDKVNVKRRNHPGR